MMGWDRKGKVRGREKKVVCWVRRDERGKDRTVWSVGEGVRRLLCRRLYRSFWEERSRYGWMDIHLGFGKPGGCFRLG